MAKPKTIPHSRALEIQEDIAAFTQTDAAFGYFGRQHFGLHGAVAPAVLQYEDLLPLAKITTTDEINSYPTAVPTFCTRDYSLMLRTMAEQAPPTRGAPTDIAPAGLLVFEEAFEFQERGDSSPATTIRAISWSIQKFPGISHMVLLVRAWSESDPAPGAPFAQGRTKLYPRGAMITNVTTGPDELPNPTTSPLIIGLVESHPALLRSSMAVEAIEPRNPKISPRTKRSLRTDSIRRVYLRHPEHARYEADEAAAARAGRAPVRAHWVRGHWRNQPYPTTGEVKWIWIDGYIKGNPENGTVTTRKLQVARASKAEVRELVGA